MFSTATGPSASGSVPVPFAPSAHSLPPNLSAVEARMAARGIQPAVIDEEMAAAVCGRTLRRFRAECPIPGQRVGAKTLRPLDLVKEWAVRNWAETAGHELAADALAADDDDYWLSELTAVSTPQLKGGRRGAAH